MGDEILLKRLRRLEGQVRGIQRLVDEGRPCEEVLVQVVAAKSAIDAVAVYVVSERVEECITRHADRPGDGAREAMDAFKTLMKHYG